MRRVVEMFVPNGVDFTRWAEVHLQDVRDAETAASAAETAVLEASSPEVIVAMARAHAHLADLRIIHAREAGRR